MEARFHRFRQFLQGVGEEASWWEEAALDGAGRLGAPSPFPWVTVRQRGQQVRRFLTALRPAVKWVVRVIYLSPLLILLRVPLVRQGHWAAAWVTMGFVVLVVAFFALISLYLVLAGVGFMLSRGRPEVALPFGQGQAGGLSFGPWRLSEADLPGADSRIKVRGHLASLGETLPRPGELLRDRWRTGSRLPRRLTEAVDFAVLGEGERPVVVRLESAPLVVASPEPRTGLETYRQEDGPWACPPGDGTDHQLLWLGVGDEVEVTGSPAGEITDVEHFELGGSVRAIVQDPAHRRAPYRAGGGRPALLLRCTPQNPLWIRKIRA